MSDKLNEADKTIMRRIILERANCGEEPEWSELIAGLGTADGRPSRDRVYRADRDAGMSAAADEVWAVADRWVEGA